MTTNDIGIQIDALYALRAQRIDLEKDIENLKKQETSIKEAILEALGSMGLEAATGNTATASIKHSTRPQVTDWDAVYTYIQENRMFELLHKRLTTTLWAALLEDGFTVPGTEPMAVTELSLTKSRR
jgi:hypothetical protein